jgi:hypothetical protein
MTVEYQPEHILGAMFELRDNQRIEDRVSRYIEEKGWSYVVELLRKGRALEFVVPGWDIPLRSGVLRDGMIELLQLKEFMGLDVDFVDAFADLEASNLEDLRAQAQEKAMDLLGEQVKRGLTFFMDLETMADTKLAIFVPDALEARTREVQKLGEKPHLYEIYSTYYGFTVLTSRVKHQEAGVPEDIRENLLSLFGDLGEVNEISSTQLKFSPLAFRKCSPQLVVLLWNMLRATIGGHKNKLKAFSKLGELGDSRALGLLHSIYDYLPPAMTIEGLCGIGHPSTYDFFANKAAMIFNADYMFEAISHVHHNGVVELIDQRADKLGRYAREWEKMKVIKAAGNTRLRTWIPFYESVKDRRSNKIGRALEKAKRNMHPPFEEEEPV